VRRSDDAIRIRNNSNPEVIENHPAHPSRRGILASDIRSERGILGQFFVSALLERETTPRYAHPSSGGEPRLRQPYEGGSLGHGRTLPKAENLSRLMHESPSKHSQTN